MPGECVSSYRLVILVVCLGTEPLKGEIRGDIAAVLPGLKFGSPSHPFSPLQFCGQRSRVGVRCPEPSNFCDDFAMHLDLIDCLLFSG